LDPKLTWQERDAYDLSAKKLAQMFVDNFKKFKTVDPAIVNAGPKP
jgi:phosphoenolpyruvate carboxykinase (ATP)